MKNDLVLSMGTAIKNIRLQKNISQEKLSRLAGVGRSYIVRLEAGDGNPSIKQLQRLAKALDATATIIIK